MVCPNRIQSAKALKSGKLTRGKGVVASMQFYDQHCHTQLSFDSEASPWDYAKLGLDVLTFTEHLDLANPASNGQDDIPDFQQTLNWQKTFSKDYDSHLLLGVEVGYAPGQAARLREVLAPYDFDIQLLSCHHNLRYDYMDTAEHSDKLDEPVAMMDQYVTQLLEAVQALPEVQVLAHFDYGFRVHNVSTQWIIERYGEQLIEVFKQCIRQDIAFELNSKSIYKYDKLALYRWAIPIYRQFGGHLFSLGSDAHEVADYQLAFDQLKALLLEFDIQEVALFEAQKVRLVRLDTITFIN